MAAALKVGNITVLFRLNILYSDSYISLQHPQKVDKFGLSLSFDYFCVQY